MSDKRAKAELILKLSHTKFLPGPMPDDLGGGIMLAYVGDSDIPVFVQKRENDRDSPAGPPAQQSSGVRH
jgi:hypothetical protein